MATLVKSDIWNPTLQLTREEAVNGLHSLIEGHFDEIGLSEAERDERYDKLRESLDAKDAAIART
jgi:hypothetical protein